MINKIIKGKLKDKAVFVCQVTAESLKVIKCLTTAAGKKEIIGLEIQPIFLNSDHKKISQQLNKVFGSLGYTNNTIILSLPSQQGTCHYLRVPSTAPEEIERISRLQAPRYLPYQSEELVTAYDILSTDKEGYSNINLLIAPQELIENYTKIFDEFKPAKIGIVLSAYGLTALYNYIKPQETHPVMVVDIDLGYAEVAIISGGKMFFSRAFRLNKTEPGRDKSLADEINKTKETYLKSVSSQTLSKIAIFGEGNIEAQSLKILEQETGLPIELLSYAENIKSSENIRKTILNSKFSFAPVIGLGIIKALPESLNLIPEDTKEKQRKKMRQREIARMMIFILATLAIFTLGIVKNFDNKARYLNKLNVQLALNEKEAGPLEDIERRFKMLEERSQEKPPVLDLLYELHKIIPDTVNLSDLVYNSGSQIILRGQAQEVNSVFAFVSELEKLPAFKNFHIKIKYVTKIKTQAQEVIDFEIGGTR